MVEHPDSKCVILISIDIKTVFNTARREHIVQAMGKAGLSHYLINLIRNYLNKRMMKIRGMEMQCYMVVPQGSVLGLIYDYITEVMRTKEKKAGSYRDELQEKEEKGGA
ncbi:hypothetical protein WA026_021824 [Henosepilachna vigintioctopunctata]|uniref:Reverse transcriptase domain-containing protein n=1 Tax=Henosepilachna vigintioctopunctata TaxID=420089 RepID=A0AAW1UPM7_9CUCU